jgi:hypothetical protein
MFSVEDAVARLCASRPPGEGSPLTACDSVGKNSWREGRGALLCVTVRPPQSSTLLLPNLSRTE